MSNQDSAKQQASLIIREAVDQQIHELVLRGCEKAASHLADESELRVLVEETAPVTNIVSCLQEIRERAGQAPHGSSDHDKWLYVDTLLRIITVQRNNHTEVLVWGSARS